MLRSKIIVHKVTIFDDKNGDCGLISYFGGNFLVFRVRALPKINSLTKEEIECVSLQRYFTQVIWTVKNTFVSKLMPLNYNVHK